MVCTADFCAEVRDTGVEMAEYGAREFGKYVDLIAESYPFRHQITSTPEAILSHIPDHDKRQSRTTVAKLLALTPVVLEEFWTSHMNRATAAS